MTATRTKSGTLSSGAGSVTFAARYNYVQVENNDGTNAIYVTTDGSTPTVGGDDCDIVATNSTVLIPNRAQYWYQGFGACDGTTTNPGTTVTMKSTSASAAYSVTGA